MARRAERLCGSEKSFTRFYNSDRYRYRARKQAVDSILNRLLTLTRLRRRSAKTSIPRAVPRTGRCLYPVVVIRIRRALDGLMRILLQFLHQPADGLFELNVAAFAPGLRIEFDLDVGRDAVVLDLPLAFGRVEGEVWRGNRAAVNQRRVAADAHESAPRAFADQRADLGAAEHIGQIIAAGARILVDQHRLRPRHHAEGLAPIVAVAHRPVAHQRLLQVIDHVIGGLSAAVEALVNDRPLLVELCEIVAVEELVAAPRGVGQVDVGQLAVTHLVNLAAVLFDPGEIAQPELVLDRHDGHFARA